MASKNVGDDEVLACPECDKTPVVTNSPGARNGDQFAKYRCTSCNAHFDEPKVREDRGGPGIRDDCLAAKLEDAEPGDLVTDGGVDQDDGEIDQIHDQVESSTEFVCSVADALENGDEVYLGDRTRPLTVLGREVQPAPGVVAGSDYPYRIVWLRGNGTEYRLRYSHTGRYYPGLNTESELETVESYSMKHGEVRNSTRSTETSEDVRDISVVGVDDDELARWSLARNLKEAPDAE